MKGKREGGKRLEASGNSRVLRKPLEADQEFPSKVACLEETCTVQDDSAVVPPSRSVVV